MPILNVSKGAVLIGSFSLTGDLITIGRAGNNDIVLPDSERKVSRYHAVLLRNLNDPEEYILRDLSSSWGTKVGGEYIFQSILNDNDVIQIADFKLDYIVSNRSYRPPLKNADQSSLLPFAFPMDIGDQLTITQNLQEGIGSLMPSFPSEVKQLFEEMISQIKNYVRDERLLESAMNLFFRALNMGEGCSGCFGLFEQKEHERILAARGMESRVPITPPSIIEKIKGGQTTRKGNQLWIPLLKGSEMCLGFLYLCKGPYLNPFNEKEVEMALLVSRIVADVIETEEDTGSKGEDFIKWPRVMIGGDKTFKEIQRVASIDSNVLLLGETGVGKEVAADEIHRQSKRREKPLRKVNCPGIPNNLLEDTLFGHKKGAFTNAIEDRRGEFETADGGTIFLDEIGNLSIDLQCKILRIIQDKVVQRVGEEKTKRVDVRVIAATSIDLEKMKEEGKFRSDLYYRFGERILIPLLRERKKDIPVLAHYFLDKYALEMNLQIRGITAQAMHSLLSYSWPGNIRELGEHCIKIALSRSKGSICLQHLPDKIQNFRTPDDKPARKGSKPKSLDDVKKLQIMEVLQYHRGNKARACRDLGITKPTLLDNMKKYGIPAGYGRGG